MRSRIKIKMTILLLFIVIFSTGVPRPASAFIWGGSLATYASNFIKTALEKMASEIENAAVVAFKEDFLKSLNGEVNAVISGNTSGNALIIVDWNNFIETTAQKKADIYVNDLITMATRGASTIDYSGRVGSHKSKMELVMKSASKDLDFSLALRPDYDEYVSSGKLSDMFADGSWAPFSASFQSNNYAPSVALNIQAIKQQKYEQAKEQQKTEAMSSGYKSVKDDQGRITTPSELVKATAVKINTASLDMVINAQGLADTLAAMASKMAMKTLRGGYDIARNSAPDMSVLATGGGFPGIPGGGDYNIGGEFSGLNLSSGVGSLGVNTPFSPFGDAPGF